MDGAVSLVQLHSIQTEHEAWNTQGTEARTRSSSMVAAPVGRVCLVEGTAWTKARRWEGPKLRNYKKISLAKAGRLI